MKHRKLNMFTPNRLFRKLKSSTFLSALILIMFASLLWSTPRQIVERETQTVGLVVESISVSGNSKTKRDVILSLLKFRVGERIRQDDLDLSTGKLNASNFFKEVNLYTQPGSSRGKVKVFVEVKERHWPFFQFKSGYSELNGWYLSPLGLRFDNFFGHGNYMGMEFLIGDRVTGLDFSFLRPNFMDSDLDFRVLLFTHNHQFVHFVNGDKFLQEVGHSGIGLRLNGRKGVLKYFWFELNRESFLAQDSMWVAGHKDQEAALPGILQPFSQTKQIGRFIFSLYADTRDQRFYPTSGWWGSLSLNQVSKELGAFTNYKKVILDVRRYQNITRGWVAAARLKGAWINDSAPFYEKFYLGGPNSLRGYADRSLNPLGYASRLVQGGVELRFPLTRKNFPRQLLTGVFFYDVGEAWSEPDTFTSDALNASLGFGFRIKLPVVGLVRLDFAYPIPEYEFKLHLSLGQTF